MHRSSFAVRMTAVPAVILLAACAEQRSPTEVRTPSVAFSQGDNGPQHAAAIVAHDACDPATFDQALQDPNACVKQGHVTFDQFIAELVATKAVSAWTFTPNQVMARMGVDVLGNNVGGEPHTFTPVKTFGGGFVDQLNGPSGNPVPAPECLSLDFGEDIVPSGGKYMIEAEELAAVADNSGVARVQCCIHPWMRAEVHLKG